MGTRTQRWGVGALALGLLMLALAWQWDAAAEARKVASTLVELSRGQGKPPALRNAQAPTPDNAPHTAPIAARINAPDGTVQEDVEVLHQLIGQYFILMQNRQGRAIGDSRDLVRVLTGSNPFHHAFIAADHPAIGPDGHLLDRWGTPYFLHQQSSRRIDVRSAGPDRQMFTADDVLNESAAARQ